MFFLFFFLKLKYHSNVIEIYSIMMNYGIIPGIINDILLNEQTRLFIERFYFFAGSESLHQSVSIRSISVLMSMLNHFATGAAGDRSAAGPQMRRHLEWPLVLNDLAGYPRGCGARRTRRTRYAGCASRNSR